jgi:hypothetical protein
MARAPCACRGACPFSLASLRFGRSQSALPARARRHSVSDTSGTPLARPTPLSASAHPPHRSTPDAECSPTWIAPATMTSIPFPPLCTLQCRHRKPKRRTQGFWVLAAGVTRVASPPIQSRMVPRSSRSAARPIGQIRERRLLCEIRLEGAVRIHTATRAGASTTGRRSCARSGPAGGQPLPGPMNLAVDEERDQHPAPVIEPHPLAVTEDALGWPRGSLPSGPTSAT